MNAFENTFTLVKSEKIDALNLEYQEYQHTNTGAKHIHLASDNTENVFLVALRTVPQDSTGVAHILEHTSLCGSERFPVRDPFFMMIRRSLNTFMNAFTSADWTAYPFASQSKKDFNNLLDVYLDAVFFARLDELDFAQEGHRLEFEELDNPDSKLLYKGVVFNEMKGAMSSVTSQQWQAIGEALFPSTTYHYNSGGEPEDIPSLSYAQLKEFYEVHYHPDNAVFMTFGDIPANEHQQRFEQLALNRFKAENQTVSVDLQSAFTSPTQVEKTYPLPEKEINGRNTHHTIAWVIGDIIHPVKLLAAHLLSNVLLENSASPLRKALETADFSNAPSSLCGLDDSNLQLTFMCGLEDCDLNSVNQFETLVFETLKQVAEDGVDESHLEALLDQLELQQREISGGGYPYGLQLILSSLPSVLHEGNPISALAIDDALKQIRTAIKEPDFIKNLINELLIDNPHRATITFNPDANLAQAKIDKEANILAEIQSSLSDEQKQQIVDTAKALQARQLTVDDPSVLPKVGLEDVPPLANAPAFVTTSKSDNSKITFYPQGTNGLTYRQIIFSLPTLNQTEVENLSLHNRLLTEVGCAEQNYLETQNRQTQVCGSLQAFNSMRGKTTNEQDIQGIWALSSKGLSSKSAKIDSLMVDTISQPNFLESSRVKDIISQLATRAESSITGQGHSLAMSCASQGLSPIAKLSHRTSGLEGIKRLKDLKDTLNDDGKLDSFCREIGDLHEKLVAQPYQQLIVEESSHQDTALQQAKEITLLSESVHTSEFNLAGTREHHQQIWVCNSQVNFCAKSYATVPAGHDDAAILTVLGGILRNGFLHTAIREQGGAYGGGASQDSMTAAFRFYSYRDPRLTETLNDFDQSLEWVMTNDLPFRVIEEAILGVIGSLDKPSSPAGTAKTHFHNNLFGRDRAHEQRFREAVLGTTAKDVKRVVEQYLLNQAHSVAVVTHQAEEKQYGELAQKINANIFSI